MTRGSHDTIAYRLSQILIKLNQGERLAPEALADEFGVHLRTIQRDLKVRLAYLPLTRRNGLYQLEPAFLGKLSFKDIERFACLAGIKGLFPALSNDFLRDIFDERLQAVWLVKSHHFEDLSDAKDIFKQLEQAIVHSRMVGLELHHEGKTKRYEAVAPYRLLNIKGIWYLAAVHQGKYKTFGIGKLQRVDISDAPFEKAPDIEAAIQNQEGVWHADTNHAVVLSVAAPAAAYFKRRPLVPHQQIAQEHESGDLTVTAEVGHPKQILPIVRYWLPHVRIVSPASWQDDLEQELSAYVSRTVSTQDHGLTASI
jgi:predicted DNA-binding transcriptional regulator YafY